MTGKSAVSFKEKIAYGVGDTASNIVFQTVLIFQLYFYTEIFGLSPALVGTLFLAVRIFDAVTDPLMGALTDRMKTKHGKYRPFLLWLAIPFGVITTLTFTTPDLSPSGKTLYAFVTYTLLMAVYTAINIPYSALGGVLTPHPEERVSVQTYRFFFGMLGGVIVTTLTLPLVNFFGQIEGSDTINEAVGYQYTMMVMSTLGVLLFLLCFWGTKERVFPIESDDPAEKNRLRDDLKALWQNDQWRILCGMATFVLIGIVMRNTLAAIYVERVMGLGKDMITLLVSLGMVGSIMGVSLANMVAKRFCKIKAYRTIQLLAALLSIAAYFIPTDQVWLVFSAYFLWNFILQMGSPYLWAKMADVVDYGHHLTGIRTNGTVYSTVIFFIKMGVALGGAMAAWLLAYYGYDAKTPVSEATKEGIALSFTIIPAIAFLIVFYLTGFYKLTAKRIAEIQENLPVRRIEG